MSLDRFELLELRREGSVQTYHAREIATARPVQVHLFKGVESAELLGLLPRLPDAERRRVLDRGESQGLPYIVTDRLAGYVDFREWVTVNSKPLAGPSPGREPTIDEQFFQLFDTGAPSFPAVAASPQAAAVPPTMAVPVLGPKPVERPVQRREDPSLMGMSIEIEAVRPRRGFFPTAAKSVLWLALGILTALAVLAGIAAFFAFRPHQ